MAMEKPLKRPQRPYFSSGPSCKPPGWSPSWLEGALLGRSHRSPEGLGRIQEVLDQSRSLLGIPETYHIALMPGSDTGAFEAALWSLLGPRPVDILDWDVFSHNWVHDVMDQLQLRETRVFSAPWGELPDLSLPHPDHDLIFVWNGTTSGVCLPHGEWISSHRTGLTFCDATSAAFAFSLPWEKLDITTYSWQKVLGGEAAHGMLILSPRAIHRLCSYQPSWPLPRLFQLAPKGQWNQNLFKGYTLNTPSLLCLEDYKQALQWAQGEGGVPGLIQKVRKNADLVFQWVQGKSWISPVARHPSIASPTSITLKITAFPFSQEEEETFKKKAWDFIEKMAQLLAQEKVGFDLKNHSQSFPSLRLWAGPTVETSDLKALLPWIEYAYKTVGESFS